MDGQRKAGTRSLRRLRTARGWSWTELATQLRLHARTLHITRIGAAQLSSIRRTIGRWESAASVPDEQYQLLLAHTYARTSTGSVALGPGSDFRELMDSLALMGVLAERLDEVAGTVSAAVTDTGTHLPAFLGAPVRDELAGALARPESLSLSLLDTLAESSRSVDRRIGTVPFVRLYLAQAAAVEACRHLLLVSILRRSTPGCGRSPRGPSHWLPVWHSRRTTMWPR